MNILTKDQFSTDRYPKIHMNLTFHNTDFMQTESCFHDKSQKHSRTINDVYEVRIFLSINEKGAQCPKRFTSRRNHSLTDMSQYFNYIVHSLGNQIIPSISYIAPNTINLFRKLSKFKLSLDKLSLVICCLNEILIFLGHMFF